MQKLTKPIKEYLKLYLILETDTITLPLGDFIVQAVEGGVTTIQLRNKTSLANMAKKYELGCEIAALIKHRDVMFIINDNVELAVAINAHGVHLGASDIPLSTVKKAFPQLITGYSCNNTNDIEIAKSEKPDYIGIGPAFKTSTKQDHRQVIGVDGIKSLATGLNIPSVGIGGINLSNIHMFKNSALSGVAVSSALCASPTPFDTATMLRQYFL